MFVIKNYSTELDFLIVYRKYIDAIFCVVSRFETQNSLIKIPLKNFFFVFQIFFRYTFNGKIFVTDIHHLIFTLKVY